MGTTTILCFGDSNTHGTRAMRSATDRGRFAPGQRWPNIMAAALGADFEVIAEGHPGRTTLFDDPIEGAHKNGLRALPVLLETHRPLDLVIVLLGTNDLKARLGVPAADIALALERLVVEILRSDCGPDGGPPAVLLAAPVPVIETGTFAEMFAGAAAKSAALPALLRDVAVRQGVGFADMGAVAAADPVDGIHLDAAAQAAIGAALAGAVREMLNQTDSPGGDEHAQGN